MTNTIRLLTIGLVVFCSSFVTVWAQDTAANTQTPPPDPSQQQPATHPVATTYSDAYEVRLKIHKYASFATLPLFATELALGESLYSDPNTSGAKKGLHGAVGVGLVGLFGVNSVTGLWNLWESRHDDSGRKRRILHTVLMLAADGGFVATAATGPSTHRGITAFDND
ncbi:MAG TPA: hypothetical protein VKY31_06360, partial [Terriglobia bacterium]|nr:hypothetical protein [Terriglobia bacterium]